MENERDVFVMKEETRTTTQVVKYKVFVADDGTEFKTQHECEDYEIAQLENKLAKIEQCLLAENCAPFDGAEHTENCSFVWYRPKSREDLDLLEKRYADQTFGDELLGKWICVDDDGCGSSWVYCLSDSIAYAQNMLKSFGYKSIIAKGNEPAIWAIKTHWASDCGADVTSNSDITLYADESTARNAFKQVVAEELDRLSEEYTIEQKADSFEAYVDGSYASNHSFIRLEKLPVF